MTGEEYDADTQVIVRQWFTWYRIAANSEHRYRDHTGRPMWSLAWFARERGCRL